MSVLEKENTITQHLARFKRILCVFFAISIAISFNPAVAEVIDYGPNVFFKDIKNNDYGGFSRLLKLLDSSPTTGITERHKFYALEVNEVRCTKIGRKLFFYTFICGMVKEGYGFNPPPNKICERAEEARKDYSLSKDMEVIGYKPLGHNPDMSINTEYGLENGLKLAIEIPISCSRMELDKKDSTLEDGISHYLRGSRGFSHSAYEDSIVPDWEKAFEIFMLHQFADRRTVIAGIYLGVHNKKIGNYDKAQEYYQLTLPIAEIVQHGVDTLHMNMGNLFFAQGKYGVALEHFKQALPISLKDNDKERQGQIYTNLGVLFSYLGDENQAISNYDSALKIAADANNDIHRARVYDSMGHAYYRLNKNTKAIEYFNKTIELAEELGDTDIALWKTSIALAYLDMGEIGRAMQHKPLEKAEDNVYRAKVYLSKKKFPEALSVLKKEMNTYDENDMESLYSVYVGTAQAYEGLMENNNAISYFEKAKEIVERELGFSPSSVDRERFLDVKLKGFSRRDSYGGIERLAK